MVLSSYQPGNGYFITLEGIEGAGKSTHQKYLAEILSAAGHEVVTTREPGGTEYGEMIRDILLTRNDHVQLGENTELLLMFAARAQHLDQVIRPALHAGKIVICDRFTDSSFAYQGGGRGLEPNRIQALQQWLHADLDPHLTILFDLPVRTGLERAGKRSEKDRFEAEAETFFDAVRRCYMMRADKEPDRFAVIDANQSIEEIQSGLDALLKSLRLL